MRLVTTCHVVIVDLQSRRPIVNLELALRVDGSFGSPSSAHGQSLKRQVLPQCSWSSRSHARQFQMSTFPHLAPTSRASRCGSFAREKRSSSETRYAALTILTLCLRTHLAFPELRCPGVRPLVTHSSRWQQPSNSLQNGSSFPLRRSLPTFEDSPVPSPQIRHRLCSTSFPPSLEASARPLICQRGFVHASNQAMCVPPLRRLRYLGRTVHAHRHNTFSSPHNLGSLPRHTVELIHVTGNSSMYTCIEHSGTAVCFPKKNTHTHHHTLGPPSLSYHTLLRFFSSLSR